MATIAAIGAGVGGIGSIMSGKAAQRAAKDASDAQQAQMEWVKKLFGERKSDIASVTKWAGEAGLLDPKALFERMDNATADSRARDTKNLVNSLFKQGGYRPGETAAEGVLGRAALAQGTQRDQQYLSMAVDAFGRRLALAGAPYETGLIGQTLQAGAQANQMRADQANQQGANAFSAVGGLASSWARYQSFLDAQKTGQGPASAVPQPFGSTGLPGNNFVPDGATEGPGGVFSGGFQNQL